MKFWVILALPWLVMSLTWTWTLAEIEIAGIGIEETWMSEENVSGTNKGQLIDIGIGINCKSNEWVVTNTTIEWNNETKHLVFNITYNEPGQPIYSINIIINDCKNHTSCSGKPEVWVEEVNCNAKTVPENYSGVCNASKVAGNLELEKEYFTSRYGQELGNEITTCVNLDETK